MRPKRCVYVVHYGNGIWPYDLHTITQMRLLVSAMQYGSSVCDIQLQYNIGVVIVCRICMIVHVVILPGILNHPLPWYKKRGGLESYNVGCV